MQFHEQKVKFSTHFGHWVHANAAKSHHRSPRPGESVAGVCLEFSKHLDTVDQDILLHKMVEYSIFGVKLKWFEDYLSQRMRYITDDDYFLSVIHISVS